jgi:hypothetical protein
VITGFRAVVRHRDLGDPPAEEETTNSEVPVPVRFFRHNGLLGSRFELNSLVELQRKGKTNVVLQYPPHNFRPVDDWPELQLAKVLADPRSPESKGRQRPTGLICHFSCHQRDAPGGARLELKSDGWRSKAAGYQVDQIKVALAHVSPRPPEPKVCFLSACKSAAVDRHLLLSALDALARLRPRSVVGTLGSVPDLIAAEFTQRFYSGLADGWSVGAAISHARAALLNAPLQNPLGILFVSYFGEDVHFSTRADGRRRFIPDDRSALGSAA